MVLSVCIVGTLVLSVCIVGTLVLSVGIVGTLVLSVGIVGTLVLSVGIVGGCVTDSSVRPLTLDGKESSIDTGIVDKTINLTEDSLIYFFIFKSFN